MCYVKIPNENVIDVAIVMLKFRYKFRFGVENTCEGDSEIVF